MYALYVQINNVYRCVDWLPRSLAKDATKYCKQNMLAINPLLHHMLRRKPARRWPVAKLVAAVSELEEDAASSGGGAGAGGGAGGGAGAGAGAGACGVGQQGHAQSEKPLLLAKAQQ